MYQKPKGQVIADLATSDVHGLSADQVLVKRRKYGLNKELVPASFSFFKTFLSQLREPLILLLAGSSVVIFFAGDLFDACIIVGIILLNATLGAFQERRISLMVGQLRTLRKQQSTVLRDGKQVVVSDELLVPGDILIVQEGDHIPADARLIEAYQLTVDESVLTGEAEPVSKISDPLPEDALTLAQQINMLFCGSHVVAGYARAVVVATGMHTATQALLGQVELFSAYMPLQKDLTRVLKFILWLIIFICVSLFCVGLVAGRPFAELLAALIALFMCVVPQGLPVIMTVILVTAAYTMGRKKIVAKRLQALEALGRAQVIVIDKTGTLTKNELMVTAIWAGDAIYTVTGAGYHAVGKIFHKNAQVTSADDTNSELALMMRAAVLLDRSAVQHVSHRKKFIVKGSTNEAALRVCATKYGLVGAQVEAEYEKLYEIPFSAAHQFHVGFYKYAGQGVLFAVGSPEVIAQRCNGASFSSTQQASEIGQAGMRILAVAYSTFDFEKMPHQEEDQYDFFLGQFQKGVIPLGLFGIQDTLREGAAEVIAYAQKAGLQVVMATGDNSVTAAHIARIAGILTESKRIAEGALFAQESDTYLLAQLPAVSVYARMLPADKARLVALFQQQGNVVMVIGDGVNDVPALSLADVGVAMGLTGSELAKQAAHIILLDDAFEKIVDGIEYGRHIFYTFKRVILYFFTTNLAEVLVMLFALAGGYPVPLVASQILWLNLVTDGFLDTALSLEPVEKGHMNTRWFSDHNSLLTRDLIKQVLYIAFLAASCSFGIFLWYVPCGLLKARTMAMVTLTCCQWITALNCRSLSVSLLRLNPFSNRWLALALGGILVTQIALVYVPVLQLVFKTVPLALSDWAAVGTVALLLVSVEEVRKYMRRRSLSAH